MNKIQPKKSLGQNFLTDDFVIDQIIQGFCLLENDNVLEIGPGTGALTNKLAKLNIDLQCVEVDKSLVKFLQKNLPKVSVIESSFLDFDFNDANKKNIRVVGNLPYCVSSQIIIHCLENVDCIHDMNFMLQEEMVDRVCAKPGSSEYSRLSVKAQVFCDVRKWLQIDASAFFPKPKVNSAMVQLIPMKNIPKVNIDSLDIILKAAFSARRKKLNNSLGAYFSKDQLIDLDIDYNLRADAVTVDEYILLSNNLT
jgi:16S rRNA (adenine1518-N6/adenine1519-N6)-dimethyltransferase